MCDAIVAQLPRIINYRPRTIWGVHLIGKSAASVNQYRMVCCVSFFSSPSWWLVVSFIAIGAVQCYIGTTVAMVSVQLLIIKLSYWS